MLYFTDLNNATICMISLQNDRKICYLIGQFPSSTHTFFWREIKALRQFDEFNVEIASTQLPKAAIATHAWAETAISETVYLFPFRFKDIFSITRILIAAFPFGWFNCLKSIAQADVSSIRERLRLLQFVILGAKFAALSKQRKWEHVHVGFCRDAANVTLFAKLLGGSTYSLSMHGPIKYFGENQRQKWSHALFGTAVSNYLLAELKNDLGNDMPPMVVAAMGVDTEVMTRTNLYKPWQPNEKLRIICVARLTPEKGQQDLLKAAAKLKNDGIDFVLTLAGEDIDPSKWFTHELQSIAKESDVTGNLRILGAVPEHVVMQELEQAHVFVLVSYAEGLGVAVMEAMCMGVPVIVSNVGGLPELVTHGTTGLIVPHANPDALHDKIRDIANTPSLAQLLSKNAAAEIRKNRGSEVGARILAQTIAQSTQWSDR